MPPLTNHKHLLALDIGDKRVGLATANLETLLATPLDTITNDANLVDKINELVRNYNIEVIVVGLPRTLSGNDSNQTNKVRQFIESLKTVLAIEIIAQDEALSSVRAEEELRRRSKPYSKADIDKLAACYILEDYINSQRQ